MSCANIGPRTGIQYQHTQVYVQYDLVISGGSLVTPVRKRLLERIGAGTTGTHAASDLGVVESNVPVRG